MDRQLLKKVAFHLIGWYVVLGLLVILEGISLYVFLSPLHLAWLAFIAPVEFYLWRYVLGFTLTKEELALVKTINANRENREKESSEPL
jgi:hypothetical protein